jgi:hypothetical protein
MSGTYTDYSSNYSSTAGANPAGTSVNVRLESWRRLYVNLKKRREVQSRTAAFQLLVARVDSRASHSSRKREA